MSLNALSVPLTGTCVPASDRSDTFTLTGLSAVSQSPSFQMSARKATVPTSNDVCAVLASPVPSVTVAVTVKLNDGSPERSAFGEATGMNVTLNTPFSSVSAVPSATKFSPSSSILIPNHLHQSG